MNCKTFGKILLVLLLSNPVFSQSIVKYDTVLVVNKNLPAFGFILDEIKNEYAERSFLINIYRIDSNNLIQTIDLSEFDYWYGIYDDPYIDTLIDVNFDGYNDLCVVTGIGANGKNWAYEIFFFNMTESKFKNIENFPEIYNIQVNDSLKQIYESYWSGCLDCIIWNTYIIEDKNLVLMKKDYQDIYPESNELRRFVEHYKDGKLISKKEIEPEFE